MVTKHEQGDWIFGGPISRIYVRTPDVKLNISDAINLNKGLYSKKLLTCNLYSESRLASSRLTSCGQ